MVKKTSDKKSKAEGKRKTSRKKPTKKRVRKTKKNEVHDAINQIPKQIMEEMGEKETERVPITEKFVESNIPRTPRETKEVAPVYHSPTHSSKWLWVGVILFSISIFILWGMSTFTMFYEQKTAYDPAREILQTSKQSFQD